MIVSKRDGVHDAHGRLRPAAGGLSLIDHDEIDGLSREGVMYRITNAGATIAVWGEGTSYNGPGGTWYSLSNR